MKRDRKLPYPLTVDQAEQRRCRAYRHERQELRAEDHTVPLLPRVRTIRRRAAEADNG